MVECSFGIEFETGFIDEDNANRCCAINTYAVTGRFSYQHDCTAGTEIVSPVFIKPLEAIWEIERQWKHWIERNEGLSPYFRCDQYHRSMGNHIHIGVPHRALNSFEKLAVADKAIDILPLLIGISAN